MTLSYKSFLATYPLSGGVIRVVRVRVREDWRAIYCTDPNASVKEILEAFADRLTIEQRFKGLKGV